MAAALRVNDDYYMPVIPGRAVTVLEEWGGLPDFKSVVRKLGLCWTFSFSGFPRLRLTAVEIDSVGFDDVSFKRFIRSLAV